MSTSTADLRTDQTSEAGGSVQSLSHFRLAERRTKMWITNSPVADIALVWAKLDGVTIHDCWPVVSIAAASSLSQILESTCSLGGRPKDQSAFGIRADVSQTRGGMIFSIWKHGSNGMLWSDAQTASPLTLSVPAGSDTVRAGLAPRNWMVTQFGVPIEFRSQGSN